MLYRRNYYKVEVKVSNRKDILENFISKIEWHKIFSGRDKLYLRTWKMAIKYDRNFLAKELEYFLTFLASLYINSVDDVRK